MDDIVHGEVHDDRLDDMIREVGVESFAKAHGYGSMLSDAETQLYPLPNRNYEAKKILCLMGMEYKKIYACPSDCILYRKYFELLKSCPTCGLSRYKLKQKDDDTIEEIEKHGPSMKVDKSPI